MNCSVHSGGPSSAVTQHDGRCTLKFVVVFHRLDKCLYRRQKIVLYICQNRNWVLCLWHNRDLTGISEECIVSKQNGVLQEIKNLAVERNSGATIEFRTEKIKCDSGDISFVIKYIWYLLVLETQLKAIFKDLFNTTVQIQLYYIRYVVCIRLKILLETNMWDEHFQAEQHQYTYLICNLNICLNLKVKHEYNCYMF